MRTLMHRSILFPLLLLCLALLAGCAGTQATCKPGQATVSKDQLAAYTALEFDTAATDGVAVEKAELDRIESKIKQNIEAKAPGRFAGGGKQIAAELRVTEYDKGNAFARAMMAGLGQIKIKGVLQVKDAADGRLLGEYVIDKAFAWGGMYGATTSIEDVEEGFAEAVAAVLLGEEPEKSKKKS